MAIKLEYYGTLDEANDYFAHRLHERAWTSSRAADRPKALIRATKIIDTLNFKGYKHAVWTLWESTAYPTNEQLRVAEASQALEFPRGADTTVPEAIRLACYEIAYSLLDGKDPERELEALSVVSQGYESVRTTYNRSQSPNEHIVNGVPSAMAWQLLRPFLRDDDTIKLSRVS